MRSKYLTIILIMAASVAQAQQYEVGLGIVTYPSKDGKKIRYELNSLSNDINELTRIRMRSDQKGYFYFQQTVTNASPVQTVNVQGMSTVSGHRAILNTNAGVFEYSPVEQVLSPQNQNKRFIRLTTDEVLRYAHEETVGYLSKTNQPRVDAQGRQIIISDGIGRDLVSKNPVRPASEVKTRVFVNDVEYHLETKQKLNPIPVKSIYNVPANTPRLSTVEIFEQEPIQYRATGTTAGNISLTRMTKVMGAANAVIGIASLPIMVREMMKESVIGWDCSEVENSIDMLRCKWNSKLNPKNDTVTCDLYQEKIQGADACGVSGLRYTFEVSDSDSKGNLKGASLMSEVGLPVQKEMQEDPAALIESVLSQNHIKTGQIKYQPIQFTPSGTQWN